MTMAGVPYWNAVSCSMYLMVGTRPDLAVAVGVHSKFAADPCPTHWQAYFATSEEQRRTALSPEQATIKVFKITQMQTGPEIPDQGDVQVAMHSLEWRVRQLEEQEIADSDAIVDRG